MLLRVALEPGQRIQRLKGWLLVFVTVSLIYNRIPRLPNFTGSFLGDVDRYSVLALWFEHQTVLEKPFVNVCGLVVLGETAVEHVHATFARQKCVLEVSIFDVLDVARSLMRILDVYLLLVNLWSYGLALVLIITFGFISCPIGLLGFIIIYAGLAWGHQFVGAFGLFLQFVLYQLIFLLLLFIFLFLLEMMV